jgi:hypothetical protein
LLIVFGLGDVAHLVVLTFNLEQMIIKNPNVHFITEPAIVPNCFWWLTKQQKIYLAYFLS